MLNWKQIVQTFQNVSIGYFIVVFLLIIADKIIMGLKWNILLRLYDVKVPYYVPVIAYLKGRVFPVFTPSNIGIDVYKVYYVRKYNNSLSKIVSSIFIERFIGMLSSLAMISLMLSFSLRLFDIPYKEVLIGAGYFLFITITFFIFFIIPKGRSLQLTRKIKFLPVTFYRKINDFLSSLSLIKEKRIYILLYYLISVFEKVSYGLVIYFCSRSLGILDIDFLFIIAATPLVALLERIPISFSALGVREGLIVFLLKPYIESSELSFSVALVLRLAEILTILLSLILWVRRDRPAKYLNEIQSVGDEVSSLKNAFARG